MTNNNTSFPAPILSGQHNFRDLGGIPSVYGGKINPGVLFRSGDLHSITDDDVLFLEKLGLSLIIDFRSPMERKNRPNREIATVKETILLPIYDAPRALASDYVKQYNAPGLNELLIHEYTRIIRDYVEEYRRFIHELTHNPNLPIVFQCSAGKDRTGLAAIFLLTALGIGEKEIHHDYYATNYYAQAHATEIIGILNRDGYQGELMKPLLEVRPEYLEAATTEIRRLHKSVENFVYEVLQANSEKLRERYLSS